MTDIICRTCKNNEFIQASIVRLRLQSPDTPTIEFDQLDIAPVKHGYICSRCNTPLREGLYKKNQMVITVVDRLIQKTIKVSDLYKEMGDTVCVLVKNRKEYLQLRAEIDSIGDQCAILDNTVNPEEKNIIVMSLNRGYEFDPDKNYFLVISRKEMEDKGLTENLLNDFFSEKFDVIFNP